MFVSETDNDQNIERVYTKMSEECSSQNINARLTDTAEKANFYNNVISAEIDSKDDINLSYDHLYASSTDNVDFNSTSDICCKCNCHIFGRSEVKFLKEWMSMHLDLIQQQSDDLSNRDLKILKLTQQNEMLQDMVLSKFPLETLTNHLQIKQNLEEMTQDASHVVEDNKTDLLLLEQHKDINLSCSDETKYTNNETVTSTTDLKKIANENCILPGNAPVKCDKSDLESTFQDTTNSTTQNENVIVEPVTMLNDSNNENSLPKLNNSIVNSSMEDTLKNLRMNVRRKRLCSGSSILSNNDSITDESVGVRKKKKRKISLKEEKILTSCEQYITQTGDTVLPVSIEPDLAIERCSSNLEVPRWRVKVYNSCYAMEGTENLEDEVFNKRHLRLENDERRRKRWDVQRIREQRMVEKLKQRQERVGSGGKAEDDNENVQSLWPSLEDVKYLEVGDLLPVSAFGAPIPRFTPSEFSLPWLNNPHASLKVTSNRKSTIRRKATKR